MDDLSIAVKVNLKKDIAEDFSRECHLTFDQRMELKVADSSNTLQSIANSLDEFCSQRQMKVNVKKSSVMKICKSRTVAFPTEITINGNFLEVKKGLKILGVMLQPNLKWS